MFLALREIKHAKVRYVLIGLIMVLIAWLVLFVSGLANGLSSANASSIQNMKANYLVLQADSENRLTRSVLSEEKVKDIQQYAQQSATPLGVQMTTVTTDQTSKKTDVTFFAVDMNNILAPTVVEGKQITNSNHDEVVADHSLKDEGFKLGDRIKDQMSGKLFTIVGFTEGQSFSHTPVIHMNVQEWTSLHESNVRSEQGFNAIALNIEEDGAQQLANKLSGVEVLSKDQALQGIPGYKEEQGSLLMMIAFLFVIAAFVLAVFFYVITIQKINQFGVLKAIGAKSSYLARNIITQVLTLSVVSLVISIALTYGVALILPSSMPFVLSPQLVAGCSGLFLVVAVLGSLLSLYRVIKIDAIEAIGRAA